MSINLSFKNILILFAVWLVASSKGILIYNEETLVALSFLCFVAFTFHYFGNRIQESLDERTLLIKGEQENLNSLKESSLNNEACEHKRVGHLRQILSRVSQFTKSEIEKTSDLTGSRLDLTNRFHHQISQNFAQFESERGAFSQSLRKSIANRIDIFVLTKFLKINPNHKKMSRKITVKSIHKDSGKDKDQGKGVARLRPRKKKAKDISKNKIVSFRHKPVSDRPTTQERKGEFVDFGKDKIKGENSIKGVASFACENIIKGKSKDTVKGKSKDTVKRKSKDIVEGKSKDTVKRKGKGKEREKVIKKNI